jgi:hypothetical protein
MMNIKKTKRTGEDVENEGHTQCLIENNWVRHADSHNVSISMKRKSLSEVSIC